MKKYFQVLLLIFTTSSLAQPASPLSLNEILTESEQHNLHTHPTWLKLIHYESDSFSKNTLASAIHSNEFFLAKNGHINAKAELKATIEAILSPVNTDSNQHAQCRFPARFLWLQSQFNNRLRHIPMARCEDFNKWSFNGKITSISLVYATGYLGNPASYYGHTLLKFNTERQQSKVDLLDTSVNYGAIVPDNENPVSYIIKGLIGGYDAGFTHIEYYFHTHNYGENELRDLWEYEINLTPQETQLIIAHAWELLGKKYTYYFLNKNCAYRMAELLEIIDGVKILPSNKLWVLPQSTIKNLESASINGKPLLKEIKYTPSRQSRLYSKYNHLNNLQKKLVHKTAKNINTLNATEFTQSPLDTQYLVLDTLLDYYQYLLDTATDTEEEHFTQHYNKVLARRYKLPAGSSDFSSTQPVGPHKGRNPSYLQLSRLNNQSRGTGTLVSMRPAYYDELDGSAGHIKNAELIMGQLKIDIFDHQPQIRSLDLVSVKNIRKNVTGLPGDRHASWQLKLGMEKQNLACRKHCLVPRLQASKGTVIPLSERTILGGMLGITAQDNRNDYGNTFVNASAFAITNFSDRFTAKLTIENHMHFDGAHRNEDIYHLTARYQLSPEWDLRVSYQKYKTEEVGISVGYYW